MLLFNRVDELWRFRFLGSEEQEKEDNRALLLVSLGATVSRLLLPSLQRRKGCSTSEASALGSN